MVAKLLPSGTFSDRIMTLMIEGTLETVRTAKKSVCCKGEKCNIS